MSDEDRAQVLKERVARKQPWHAPPHLEYEGDIRFIVTAACYEHKPIIGKSLARMTDAETELIKVCSDFGVELFAWCVLPNHYHLLVQTDKIREFQEDSLGKFHGKFSYRWNGEDDLRDRKIWYKSFERPMKSNRHFWASLNYVHHNAVHHGYVSNETRYDEWLKMVTI